MPEGIVGGGGWGDRGRGWPPNDRRECGSVKNMFWSQQIKIASDGPVAACSYVNGCYKYTLFYMCRCVYLSLGA